MHENVSEDASDDDGGGMIMEVAILMLVIFLFTDIMVVGICMLAYAGKEEYSGGMLLACTFQKKKWMRKQCGTWQRHIKRSTKNFSDGT